MVRDVPDCDLPKPGNEGEIMRKSLLFALLFMVGCQQAGAGHHDPCALMTLDDARSLIGADAKRDPDAAPPFTTKDATCWYEAGPREDSDHAFVIVEEASGKTWLAFKERTDTKKVDGLGDEAYFMDDSDTLWMRKGATVLIIEAYKKEKAGDQKAMEEAFARKVLSRL
jgi:hypothetical protein